MGGEEISIRFSVVMPTYNNAAFIRRAVNSLLRQSYPGWELIIVDDGSDDDTFLRTSRRRATNTLLISRRTIFITGST